MDHVIDLAHRGLQPLRIAHVADEEPDIGAVREERVLRHLELLELVARKDGDALGLIPLQYGSHEPLSEGTGTAGDENGLAVDIRIDVHRLRPHRNWRPRGRFVEP